MFLGLFTYIDMIVGPISVNVFVQDQGKSKFKIEKLTSKVLYAEVQDVKSDLVILTSSGISNQILRATLAPSVNVTCRFLDDGMNTELLHFYFEGNYYLEDRTLILLQENLLRVYHLLG